MDFTDIVADTERNNLVIQSALRDSDRDTLVAALVGMDEAVRLAFLRNLSRRTSEAIEGEIALREGRTTRDRAEAARAHLLQLLRTHDGKTPAEVRRQPRAAPPAVSLGSQREIIETFRALAEYAQANGLLSLEKVEPSVTDPYLGKGLRMIVDGWDALDWRSIMEKHKQAHLRATEARLDMILDGLESLQSGEPPRVVEERLSAYVVPS